MFILAAYQMRKYWCELRSGILALADKGFIIQHIFDSYGVRIDTPQKLAGEKQFNEQEDVHNWRNSQVRVHVE